MTKQATKIAMATKGLLTDGLWLCLRPSLARYSSTCVNISPPWKRGFKHSSSNPSAPNSLDHDGNALSTERTDASIGGPSSSPGPNDYGKRTSKLGTARRQPSKSPHKEIIHRRNKTPRDLEQLSSSNLENMLQDVVMGRPSHDGALRIATELIEHRNVKPQTRHYRAMILANVHSIKGSAPQVEKLLNEMELNGVVTDSGTLHAALKVTIRLCLA